MKVAGLTPLSTIDYPGQLSAVAFCQGCPWRCVYCHNPQLQVFKSKGAITWDSIISFLQRRRHLLDAFVFSGGEPTVQQDVKAAIQEVKELGFKVGLHTAGINPQVLESILPWLDWVGLDIKADEQNYQAIAGVEGGDAAAFRSLQLILNSGVECEVRTTVHSAYLAESTLLDLARRLSDAGVSRYVVQQFRNVGCSNAVVKDLSSYVLPEPTRQALSKMFAGFAVR